MKRILLLALVGFVLQSNAQKSSTSKVLDETKIGRLTCKYKLDISSDGDSSIYVIMLYQNAKYQMITDIKSVVIQTNNTKDLFVNALKLANETEVEEGVKKSWETPVFEITKGFGQMGMNSGLLMLENKEGFTYLTKRQAKNLIEWLQSLRIFL